MALADGIDHAASIHHLSGCASCQYLASSGPQQMVDNHRICAAHKSYRPMDVCIYSLAEFPQLGHQRGPWAALSRNYAKTSYWFSAYQVSLYGRKTGRQARGTVMDQRQSGSQNYLCPMHSAIRQSHPGKCPKCGMDLLPEGTRFVLLRHMISSPLHLAVMAAVMVALMAAPMLLMR